MQDQLKIPVILPTGRSHRWWRCTNFTQRFSLAYNSWGITFEQNSHTKWNLSVVYNAALVLSWTRCLPTQPAPFSSDRSLLKQKLLLFRLRAILTTQHTFHRQDVTRSENPQACSMEQKSPYPSLDPPTISLHISGCVRWHQSQVQLLLHKTADIH